MKKGVIIVLFSLLTTTAMTGVYSQNNVRIQPGPVEVKQGKRVSLWCKVEDLINEVPVHWQSPPDFQTRTSNCFTFAKQKYVIYCPESPFRWYNLTIMDVQWTDRGKYRCIHGESMDIVDLQVLVPVTNVLLTHDSNSTAEPLLMNKDMETVFKCRTNCAYPTPNISWFENGQPFKDRPTVNRTKLGCIGDEEGLEQTISMVTVTGKSVDKEQKTSTILCKANNTIGEEHVSMNINYDISYDELPKTPQSVMATDGTVDVVTILLPFLLAIIVVLAIVIVGILCKKKIKKYWSGDQRCIKDVRGDRTEMKPLLPKQMRDRMVIYEYDDTRSTDKEGIAFLGDLREGLRKQGFKVELRKVKRSRGRPVSNVLEELDQESKSKKVILSFPEDTFCEDQLRKTFKAIMQGAEKPFVAVIIQTEAFMPVPSELQRIQKLWNEKRQTQGLGRAKYHLQFLKDHKTTKQVDVSLRNLGTGLAWSYYFGYLMYLLKVHKETLLTSKWQDENPDIPGNRISKQIHIVFSTDCQKPKIMDSERITLKCKKNGAIDRAGLKRDYYLEIQEVKSKDRSESYYGVVCFLTAVQCLLEMKDDPDEDDMRTHGQDCFEKLKLVINHNETIKKDQLKLDFIEFNTEAANADEDGLADDLFNRMKKACSLETRSPNQESPTHANQTGAVEEISYDQLSHNIGPGLAVSWYYKFLKIKIPKVRDVIEKCAVLKKKFQEGEMPHKLFILLPSSCCCPGKLPCDNMITEVKDINLPHIKKDNRDYTPKVYSLNDDGKTYYAFVEFCAPADIMYRMTQEGFLKMPKETLQEEWERFFTKLKMLIKHKDMPMDIKNRIFFIQYEDDAEGWKDCDLEEILLGHVKDQIPLMKKKVLPTPIDNGATVEVTEDNETKHATHGDTIAGGWEEHCTYNAS